MIAFIRSVCREQGIERSHIKGELKWIGLYAIIFFIIPLGMAFANPRKYFLEIRYLNLFFQLSYLITGLNGLVWQILLLQELFSTQFQLFLCGEINTSQGRRILHPSNFFSKGIF